MKKQKPIQLFIERFIESQTLRPIFLGALAAGLVAVSSAWASIPQRAVRITNDTVIHQKIRETRVQPQKEISFESDVARLAALEKGYDEKLPKIHPRIKNSVERISRKPYKRTVRN